VTRGEEGTRGEEETRGPGREDLCQSGGIEGLATLHWRDLSAEGPDHEAGSSPSTRGGEWEKKRADEHARRARTRQRKESARPLVLFVHVRTRGLSAHIQTSHRRFFTQVIHSGLSPFWYLSHCADPAVYVTHLGTGYM
jgi:hypothetical protein